MVDRAPQAPAAQPGDGYGERGPTGVRAPTGSPRGRLCVARARLEKRTPKCKAQSW